MIVIATADASVADAEGMPVTIRRGEAWRADDDVVARFPGMFTDDPSAARSTQPSRSLRGRVEQATAAPGERRR